MHITNRNEVDLCDIDFDDPKDYDSKAWDELIVSYLKAFYTAVHPTAIVKVHVAEGFILHIQHYCNDGYYCTLHVTETGRYILAKIYSNI